MYKKFDVILVLVFVPVRDILVLKVWYLIIAWICHWNPYFKRMIERIQYYNVIEIYKRQLIPVVTLIIESMCPLRALWKNWDNVKTYTIKFFMLKWIGVNSKWMFNI